MTNESKYLDLIACRNAFITPILKFFILFIKLFDITVGTELTFFYI